MGVKAVPRRNLEIKTHYGGILFEAAPKRKKAASGGLLHEIQHGDLAQVS